MPTYEGVSNLFIAKWEAVARQLGATDLRRVWAALPTSLPSADVMLTSSTSTTLCHMRRGIMWAGRKMPPTATASGAGKVARYDSAIQVNQQLPYALIAFQLVVVVPTPRTGFRDVR